jgi:rhodanese-related sulfurtransferase
MNARIIFSVWLVGLGIIAAFLPINGAESFRLESKELLAKSLDGGHSISVDQAARYLNNEDSTVQFIDLRSPEEFRECNIPGSVNIPFPSLLDPLWEATIHQKSTRTIFYGNGDQIAAYAWTIATGKGYKNCFILKGGLNEWFRTVMNSNFSVDKITPAENARFEARVNARKSFTQINSLPDSLKTRFFSTKRLKQSKLDGGCE